MTKFKAGMIGAVIMCLLTIKLWYDKDFSFLNTLDDNAIGPIAEFSTYAILGFLTGVIIKSAIDEG